MKVIPQSVNVWPYDMPILKRIEEAGRVCYRSEDKIKEGSAETFISNLIKRGHESVLEHGSIIVRVEEPDFYDFLEFESFYESYAYTSYLRHTYDDDRFIISGNARAFRDYMKMCLKYGTGLPKYFKEVVDGHPILFPEFKEVKWLDNRLGKLITINDLVTVNELLTHVDVTVKFTTNRVTSQSIVRHRPSSFSQESTRYCNYSQCKFGNEITFVESKDIEKGTIGYRIWEYALSAAEVAYFDLIAEGYTPEQARDVLPNSLKTSLVMTTNLAEWKHFIELRTSTAAHPMVRELAEGIKDVLARDFKEVING